MDSPMPLNEVTALDAGPALGLQFGSHYCSPASANTNVIAQNENLRVTYSRLIGHSGIARAALAIAPT